MRILGVDPGTHRTGAGVIEVQGNRYRLIYFEVIHPKAKDTLPDRLQVIYRRLCEIMGEYGPDVCSLENVFFGRDVKAMLKIGEARACAMLAASGQGIPVVEYAPAQVKQSVSGNGRATKDQVQQMVRRLLNLREAPPADGADALAVAICHVHHRAAARLREKGSRLAGAGK